MKFDYCTNTSELLSSLCIAMYLVTIFIAVKISVIGCDECSGVMLLALVVHTSFTTDPIHAL